MSNVTGSSIYRTFTMLSIIFLFIWAISEGYYIFNDKLLRKKINKKQVEKYTHSSISPSKVKYSGNGYNFAKAQPRACIQKMAVNQHIKSGLIIKEEPLNKILNNEKIWEMRTSNTKKRETIALIKKGSKKIYGVATIVDSLGPLSDQEMIDNISFHKMKRERIEGKKTKKWRHAWVLFNVQKLPYPVSYSHKNGQQTFVTLCKSESDYVEKQLNP